MLLFRSKHHWLPVAAGSARPSHSFFRSVAKCRALGNLPGIRPKSQDADAQLSRAKNETAYRQLHHTLPRVQDHTALTHRLEKISAPLQVVLRQNHFGAMCKNHPFPICYSLFEYHCCCPCGPCTRVTRVCLRSTLSSDGGMSLT